MQGIAQVPLGGLELAFQLDHAGGAGFFLRERLDAATAIGLDKADEQQLLSGVGNGPEIEIEVLAAGRAATLPDHRLAGFPHRLDTSLEFEAEPGRNHGKQVRRRVSLRGPHVAVGRPQRVDAQVLRIDQHGGRGEAVHDKPTAQLGKRSRYRLDGNLGDGACRNGAHGP